MSEMQMTLNGSFVPTKPHVDDIVDCHDGSDCRYGDAIFDCEGEAHRTDEDKHDRNVEIVSDFLNKCGKWAEQYCTENTDYADGLSHMVNERRDNWACYVREWVENEFDDDYGNAIFDDYVKEIVDKVCEELDGDFDCEPEYCCSNFSAYSGDGCCLDSFDIGEYEDQIEINAHDVLRVLHEEDGLDDVLDDVNCDVCVNRDMPRVKNEETGRYEYVGRSTYMPYKNDRKYPTLLIYANVSGQWQFVVSADRMNELVCDALLEYHGCDE